MAKHAANNKPQGKHADQVTPKTEQIESASQEAFLENDSCSDESLEAEPPVFDNAPWRTVQMTSAAAPAAQVVSGQLAEEKPKRKGLKIFGIVAGILLAILLVVYCAGIFVFSGRFLPNTYIGDIDVSLKTPNEVHVLLEERAEGYSFQITGQGIEIAMTGEEAGVEANPINVTSKVLSETNTYLWPVEVLKGSNYPLSIGVSFSNATLQNALDAAVAPINETATQPTNATLAYDEEAASFVAVPETYGTALDSQKITNAVTTGIDSLQPIITLGEEVLLAPTIFADDERFPAAIEEANKMAVADFDIMLGETVMVEVTPKTFGNWLVVDENITVTFNEELFTAWVDQVVAGCNTVGAERNYTRPDGKQVTVSGGPYGWEADATGLGDKVKEAVKSGSTESITIPVTTAGKGYTALGQDWGMRYCDVDKSEQHARFYNEAGELIWESDVVTGRPGMDTPEGVYYITNGMASPTKLYVTYDPEKQEWTEVVPVDYWMPFVGNSIGLHDATWQSAFGGDLWQQGRGSHGCVNLPLDKAAELWDIIERGDVVVVHW